jgi:hypothetical protein
VKLVPRYNGMARPEDADVESLQIASKNLYWIGVADSRQGMAL